MTNQRSCALVAFVVAVTLVGCNKKDPGASSEELQPTCASVAAAYGKVLGAAFAKQSPDKPDAAKLVEDSVLASCEGDRWPEQVLSCLSATHAKDTMMEACINSLPKDLQTKMEDSIKAKLTAAP